MSIGEFAGYWREKDRVVMDRNAVLPDRCVRCNQPAAGYRRVIKLSHSSIGTRAMFGEVGAQLFAKRAEVAVGLCEAHRDDRRRAITPALVATAALLGMFALVGFVRSIPSEVGAVLIVGAVVVFVVGAFIALARLIASDAMRATKITATHLWLNGAGKPFLASLPAAPPTANGMLPTVGGSVAHADPAAEATDAYRVARNGAIVFAAGCLLTAGSYLAAPGGRFLILWGLAIAGLAAVARGLASYAKVPPQDRQRAQIATLAGILALGVVSGGWVIASQVKGSQDEAAATEFTTALDRAAVPHKRGLERFQTVMDRPGAWSAEDSADMQSIAADYGQAADILAAARIPSDFGWYREGIVQNLREARDIATGFAKLSASSSQSSFDTLLDRWRARAKAYDDLQKRLEAQSK